MAGVEWALLLIAVPVYFFSGKLLAFTNSYGPQKRVT